MFTAITQIIERFLPGAMVGVVFALIGIAIAFWMHRRLVARDIGGAAAFDRYLFRRVRDAAMLIERGVVLNANDAAARLLGRGRKKLIGVSFVDLLADPADEAQLIASLRGGEVLQYPIVLRTASGEKRSFLMTAAAHFDGEGVCTAMDVILEDAGAEAISAGELRASEADYRAFVEHVHDAVLLLDGNALKVIDANQRAVELYQYPREQLIGLDCAKLAGTSFDSLRLLATTHPNDSHSVRLRGQHVRRDSTVFEVEINATLIQRRGETLILTFNRDVSLEREPDVAVREREEKFRLLLEGVTEYAIVMLDRDGRVVSWNEGAERLSGYSEDEIVGKPLSMLFPPEGGEDLSHLLARAVVMGRLDFEATRRRKDGTLFAAAVTMTTIVETPGTVRGFAVVIQDITARVELERARLEVFDIVRAKANEWTATFDAVHVPIVLLDQDGAIRRLNRAAQSLAGLPFTALIHKPVIDLKGEPWQTIGAAGRQTFEHGSASNVKATEGESVWLVSSSIAGTSAGERRAIVVAYDLTVVNRLEVALRQNEVAAALGAMVAGVAHEVRNPLFTISATLDAWQARYGSSEGMARYSGTLREQVSRLTRLMRDLLEYGKPHDLTLEPVLLPDVIHSAAADCAPLAAENSVDVLFDLDASLPPIQGDGTSLRQVFQNIIDNAIRHSPHGSSVLVEAVLDGETAVVRIADSGVGASDDDLEKAFTPFYSRRRGGTGLGLPIARTIVNAHHGELMLRRREDGPGIVAVIQLPISQPAAVPARDDAATATPNATDALP